VNLMCIHYMSLIGVLQLWVSNFAFVFLTYCFSPLVLAAALVPPPPPSPPKPPPHLPFPRRTPLFPLKTGFLV